MCKNLAAQMQKSKPLRNDQDFRSIRGRRRSQKAMGRVRRKFGKNVPDNGHEHSAHSDEGFLVTIVGSDLKQVHMMDTGRKRYSVIADFKCKRKIV